MKFSIENHSKNAIQNYDANGLTINGKLFTHPLIITPEEIIDWTIDAKNLNNFQVTDYLSHEPEVVLLGLGTTFHYPREIMQLFISQGVGIEVMKTEAACRTFNLLLNEGRRVVAGLIL